MQTYGLPKGCLFGGATRLQRPCSQPSGLSLSKKKEFVAAALNEDKKTFAVHVASSLKPANLSRDAQITSLNAEKAPDAVPSEYSNYVDVFLLGSTAEILEHNSIGDYAIDLVDGKQPPFGQIYSLGRWS